MSIMGAKAQRMPSVDASSAEVRAAAWMAQGNREDGSIAVDNVAAEQQRDAQAALFHGDALRFGAIGGASSV
jgi:hypothetical protein